MPIYPPLFRGSIANATTAYVGVPVASSGRVYLDIEWKDATSAATITLETTGQDSDSAPVAVTGAANVWKADPAVIAGPTAVGAGSTKVQTSNINGRRARLKIVTTAISDLEIYSATP
ncbi:MAG: hypothetical protein H0V17_12575 [Deltaproteobacteria bacterium]|nr:hypothetical protein [Deltaproteobacteria bacterium]